MSSLSELYAAHIEHLGREYGAAIDSAGYDALVLHAGTPRTQNAFDDQYWPLRPTPAFAHWLPLREAGCALVIQPGRRPTLYRPVVEDFWEGQIAPEGDHFWDAFEVVEVGAAGADAAAQIGSALPTGRVAFIGEDAGRAAAWGIADDAVNPPPLTAALDRVRAHKTDYERRCIGEANRRAARGHARLFEAFAAGGGSELSLHLLYLAETGQDDSQTPYKNIVALGEHAAVLHHIHYDAAPTGRDTESLLVDAGATYMGYASDITRTAVRGDGDGADVFGALIERVEALQAEICRRVAPGLPYEDLHDQAHALLASILRDLGLATGSDEALVDGGVTRAFFPHGLGHSLGIQVHDVGCKTTPPRDDNPFLRNTSAIAPGQVFTIEPGCYFIDGLLGPLRASPAGACVHWERVDALRSFGGVRIEDNLAVLADTTANLTRDNWPDSP